MCVSMMDIGYVFMQSDPIANVTTVSSTITTGALLYKKGELRCVRDWHRCLEL